MSTTQSARDRHVHVCSMQPLNVVIVVLFRTLSSLLSEGLACSSQLQEKLPKNV